jgi:4'-phosphopantetheinyl transferase
VPIGVDLERVRPLPDAEAIATQVFSSRERVELQAVEPADRTAVFFAVWTQKEAYCKATGRGLSLPLDSFDVYVSATDRGLLSTHEDPAEAAHWSLMALPVDPGFVATVAVRDTPRRSMFWQWP